MLRLAVVGAFVTTHIIATQAEPDLANIGPGAIVMRRPLIQFRR